MTKIGLLSCLFLTCSLWSSESVIKSYDKSFELSQTDRGYSLKNDTFSMHFPAHQVSKPIRNLRADQLAALLNSNAYYLKATELSDGTHALDLQGRLPGSGLLTGAAFGYVFGKVIVPGIIVVPGIGLLYATKAFIHLRLGPAQGAAFQQQMDEYLINGLLDFALQAGDAVAPVAAAIGGVTGGPV